MTKNPNIRVVGRRAFRSSDFDNPDASFSFDEDGDILVEEAVEVRADDATALASATAKRRSEAEALVDALSPSAYAVHLALHDALRPHAAAIASRFAGDPPHLLVAVRVADEDWYVPAAKAFSAVVAGLVADRISVSAKTVTATPEKERYCDGYRLSSYSVLRHVCTDHLIAAYSDAQHLPDELRPFCDVVLDLTRIDRRHFDLAIEREFDETGDAGWPERMRLADVDPGLLDSVCSRAGRVGDVVPLLRGVLDARAAEKKKEAKATVATTSLSSKKAAVEILRPTGPRLEDLHGYAGFGVWGRQLADDLADHRAGGIAWSDVDAGCLLHGPPGTGKTLAASALAASCGVAFIPTSFAAWQGVKGGYLGDVTNALRTTFAAAAEHAPCILFIDEIDSIPSRGRSRDHDDYWRPIVNAMLESLDGTARREGVVVIAACNDPSQLDPALVRSGRLDRRFEIGLPDESALLGIMRHHLPDADPAELAPAATALAGVASGADVARIARDARRTARREKRAVSAADLLAIAIPADHLSERDRRLVAVHEAGHAVAMMCAGRLPEMLSIVTAGGSHGGVRADVGIGMGRLGEFEAEVVARLAGRAAEEIVLGEPSAGAEGDLQNATALVTQMLGRAGLGGRLLHAETIDGHAVEARLRDLYGRTLRLVGEHRAVVERLADLAVERRVLGHAALAEFASAHGLGGRT